MEARKIIVISTRNQKRSTIMSTATTLAELKADLRNNGINYDGMTFYEGTSKTELKTDNSILPHDVPYKGTITNELVFMLTNTNKKIRSGQNRMLVYAAIRANNLQDECIKRFGRNYTQCSTANLVSLIEETTKKSTNKSVQDMQSNEEEVVDIKVRAALARLTELLYLNSEISDDERIEIMNIMDCKIVDIAPAITTSKSPYSDKEIDDMFDFI